MNVIHVSYYDPDPRGDGGYHRAYQVTHDLEEAVGKQNIATVRAVPPWQTWRAWPSLEGSNKSLPERTGDRRWELLVRRVRRGIQRYIRNPYRLLNDRNHKAGLYLPTYFNEFYFPPSFLEYYTHVVKNAPRPAYCLLENSRFADIVEINEQYGIPTIACVHNIEALETPVVKLGDWGLYSIMADLATEYSLLARCLTGLYISKVETGLTGGLGLSSAYYPYLPVGEIKARLGHTRAQRRQVRQEKGLFLLLGSATHHSTGASFAWFCRQARQHGLPPGVRVIAAGNGTDKLLPVGERVDGLELRGWIQQDELDDLLLRAQAVLIPQLSGFGALTRLPELSCAGIPVLVSRHPTQALNVPPGVTILENEWEAWKMAMAQLPEMWEATSSENYALWEAQQPRPLGALLKRLPT